MKRVATYYSKKDDSYRKQMPVYVSTLKKKFYLNRNKDRDLLLRIIDKLEEIERDVKEIKHKIVTVRK